MIRYRTLCCLIIYLVLTNVSSAQEPQNDPEDPAKTTENALPLIPKIGYSSVFENYVPFDHLPNISWQEANDNVAEIGGWRAYLKMVQDAAKPEASPEEDKE